MAGAVAKLKDLLNSNPSLDFQLIVVSDGMVSDSARVIADAETLRENCQRRSGAIDASLLRLITSNYGSPDTRALSCLGSLSGTKCDVLDLDGRCGLSDEIRNELVLAIRDTLGGCEKSRVNFNMPLPRSLLGDGDRVSHMSFSEGRHYIMLPTDIDVSILKLEFEGRTYAVASHEKPFGEDDIQGFLRFLESRMRMLAVVGDASSRATLIHMSSWLSGVEGVLNSMKMAKDKEDDEKEEEDFTLASRKKVILSRLLKSKKGLINSLKQLANSDAVAGLNSQQKADFLRGASYNRSGRALAKRAAKADMTPDELAAEGIRNLATAVIPMDEEGSDTCTRSFYSHATAPECLELAVELNDQGASAVEVLQLIGLPGIAFNAPRGNYIDPWSFRVEKVFTGDSCILSQSDLWHYLSLSGGSSSLCPPGSTIPITGVDPVGAPNRKTYDVYLNEAAGINRLHASVSMRGMIAPVSDDDHAIKTAVALHLINSIAQGTSTESIIHALQWEIADLSTLTINRSIQENMTRSEPGAYFTGDLGIGNVMRLYCTILGWTNLSASLRKSQRQRVLRDIYSLAVYHKLKRIDCRDTSIQNLLGLDISSNATPLSDLFEPNDPHPEHCSLFQLNAASTILSKMVPSPDEVALVARARELTDVGASLRELEGVVDIETAYGVKADDKLLWTNAVAVQALKCSKASHRVDTNKRVMLTEQLVTHEQCSAFLSNSAREQFKADYEKRLRSKIAEEARVTMLRQVEDLVKADSMEAFITLLQQQVPSRSSETFVRVLNILVDSPDPPLRFRKMWVCLLGRNKRGEPVWNGGTCLVGDLTKYCEAFHNAGKGKLWKELKDMRAKYPVHRYREGKENRHGHSNEFPSFYFWGYSSLECFKAGVDSDTFRTYCIAHSKKGCCGLG